MNFISIIFLFCSFNINLIQNARSSSSNYQIDEFIAQLMTSERFNELADIIAERAATKIKNSTSLQHSSKNHKKVKNKKSIKENPHDREAPPSILRQRKEEDKSGKFGTINIKAFLKRGASSQELFLNYKHMTKDLKKDLNKYGGTKKKEQRSELKDNILFSDHSAEQKEKAIDSGSSERKMKAGKSDENITKPRSFTSEEKHLNVENKNTNSDTTPNTFTTKEPSPSEELIQGNIVDDTVKITTQSKYDHNPSDLSNSDIRKDENKKTTDAIIDPSKEVLEVGLQQALDTKSDEVEPQTLVKIDYSSNESKNTEPMAKQIIRRENGKLYTYVSSSDYEEYHEDVKNHRLTDNRFINTYK